MADRTILLYLFILGAHLGHQHSYVVSVPHPGVTGEVLQNHHGFVKASDCLHHPIINKRRTQNYNETKKEDGMEGDRNHEIWKIMSQQSRKDRPCKGKKVVGLRAM